MIAIKDELMGSGKSSKMINNILNAPVAERWIVVVPFLEEVDRYVAALESKGFVSPFSLQGSKQNHLRQLVEDSRNIVITHALLKLFDMNTFFSLLSQDNYHLVIDEALEVVEVMSIPKDDLTSFLETGRLTVDDDGFVSRNHNIKTGWSSAYNDLWQLIDNGSILMTAGELMVWEYPKRFLESFKNITVLTYNFEGTLFSSYLKYHGLEYIVQKGVQHVNPALINIVSNSVMNSVGDGEWSLSATKQANWKSGVGVCVSIQKHLESYFKNTTYATSTASERMVSCYKGGWNAIKGKGYSKSFTSYNLIAVNDYRECHHLAYVANVFVHPHLINLFSKRGIPIDQDAIALNTLLQWLFRSRVRSGEQITIYVPSSRMRGLLQQWIA